MAILNLEELKRQIKEGTFTGLESLEYEFRLPFHNDLFTFFILFKYQF